MTKEIKSSYSGRFNYLSFRADLYNILFVPFHGTTACIIARNLPKEDALALIAELNSAMDESREGVAEIEDEEM